jgi:hypothetical protein
MQINLSTVIRASVESSINGMVWLDRGSHAAFCSDPLFQAMLLEYMPGSLRGPTTGHDNLPKSHPMNTRHTYKFQDFTTAVKGNFWHPNYNGIGYTDEDGNPGTGTGLIGAGPISEIIGPVPFADTYVYLAAHSISARVHYFLDWQSGYSEGFDGRTPPLNTGGVNGDYQWYKNPEPFDIDGNPIDGATSAAMTSLQHKNLENRRVVKYLKVTRGLTNLIINVGGEDWLGWDNTKPLPWFETIGENDDNSNKRFQWISNSRKAAVDDMYAFIVAQGWTDVLLSTGFLESHEGGRDYPSSVADRDRNRTHLQMDLANYGGKIAFLSSSMHSRADFPRFLREPTLRFAFPTDSGSATYQEASDFIKDFCTGKYPGYGPNLDSGSNNFPNIRLLPMANSVGDARITIPWAPNKHYTVGTIRQTDAPEWYICLIEHDSTNFTTDLALGRWRVATKDESSIDLNDHQRGLLGIQLIGDTAKSDIKVSQFYPGMAGNCQHAGFIPAAGHTGMANGVFTKFPLYHATKTFGPVLNKNADLVSVTGETTFWQLVLKYTEAGKTYVAVWLINKKFTGDYGEEIGVGQTVPLTIPNYEVVSISNVRRFSPTELDNPLVSGLVTNQGGGSLSVDMTAFSSVSFIAQVESGSLITNPAKIPANRLRILFAHTKKI